MKLKTIIYLLIISVLIFIIYLTSIDKKIYYLDLNIDNTTNTYSKLVSDYLEEKSVLEKKINCFVDETDRVTDLVNMIFQNKSIIVNNKNQTIQNALIKADLVTVFVGLNDINYKIGYSTMNELYDYADSFLIDMKNLIELLREYCKEEIILIGYYNIYGSLYDEYFEYINKEISAYAEDYNINFINPIDIYNINNSRQSIFLNKEENKQLFKKIVPFIDNNILK